MLKAEITMTASIKEKAWSRPPMTLDFQVPMYTASGLHVRFLKVFEKCTDGVHRGVRVTGHRILLRFAVCVCASANYQTVKWVRYITKAGRYEVRL